MRVIAGKYRSRPLVAPRGAATRPTSDRLRETLFNILAPRIEGCRFADLYAGSGAVGIEALSRGAAHVLFVEKAPPAAAAIRANLAALGIASGFTLETRSISAVLERLAAAVSAASPLDIVFLDPPWESIEAYAQTLHTLGCTPSIFAEGALVIAEHASRHRLAESYGVLRRTRTLKQGDAALTFYAAESASSKL